MVRLGTTPTAIRLCVGLERPVFHEFREGSREVVEWFVVLLDAMGLMGQSQRMLLCCLIRKIQNETEFGEVIGHGISFLMLDVVGSWGHHALNAFDGGNGQLLRVEYATGKPAAVTAHVAPDHFDGSEASAQGGANRQFLPVEHDGGYAGIHRD